MKSGRKGIMVRLSFFHFLTLWSFIAFCCSNVLTFQLLMHQDYQIQNSNHAAKIKLTRSAQLVSSMLFGGLAAASMSAQPSQAVTYFDTEVYGDKELKIATVNKMKQKLRNEIHNNISLTPIFLKLAINDALGYSVETQDGGPDGSILFEMDRDANKGLENGILSLKKVQDELKRTNTVGFGDICAFAGVVALESVGCGRLTTQVGRFDAKKENSKKTVVNWNSMLEDQVVQAFVGSGLDSADMTLMLSAIAETERIVQEALAPDSTNENEDDDFEPQPFIPSSFGSRDDTFGSKIGKSNFGTNYISTLLTKKETGDPISQFLQKQNNLKTNLGKYLGNDVLYKKDVSNLYLKISTLGSQFTTRNS